MAEDVTRREDHSVKRADEQQHPQWSYTPRVDIYEDEQAFHVEAEMPGVGENDVDVTVEQNQLHLLGRRAAEEHDDYRRGYTEYEVGNYERTFTVPPDVDPDKIQAVMKHGVLHVTLPKREAARPTRVKVQAG